MNQDLWILQIGRGTLRRVRHTTGRVGRLATRFKRSLEYVFDLLIWSRIFAGRRGVLPIELPEAVLRKKGVDQMPPVLRVGGKRGDALRHIERGFAEVYAVLFANLRTADLLSPFRHALPGPAFRGVYLWDSAFIAQVWRAWDPVVAADILRSVIHLRDGNRLQHVVADFVQSQYTQPPLISWALTQSGMEDPEVLRWAYDPLVAYQGWLDEHRRLANGLYAWAHPYESGVENSPRFSSRDEKMLRDTRTTAAVDFSSYVVLQLEALCGMATMLDRPAEAAGFVERAEALRQCVNRELWNEEAGLYLDRDSSSGTWIGSRTVASLMPLWAGIPTPERAKALRDHCLDPEMFGTMIPFPSVALSDPDFERDMWRGSVWVNMAYAAILGLRRYGFWKEAGELAWRLCDGVYRVFEAEEQFYEFYDPTAYSSKALARKRGNFWKAFTLGTGPQREFVGWSGLVNTLMMDVLFGLEWVQGEPQLRPVFPVAAANARFALDLDLKGLTVALEPRPDGSVVGIGMWNGKAAAWDRASGDVLRFNESASPRGDS